MARSSPKRASPSSSQGGPSTPGPLLDASCCRCANAAAAAGTDGDGGDCSDPNRSAIFAFFVGCLLCQVARLPRVHCSMHPAAVARTLRPLMVLMATGEIVQTQTDRPYSFFLYCRVFVVSADVLHKNREALNT